MVVRNSKEFLQEAKKYFDGYDRRYIFIRVPKNASTSFTKSFGKIRHYSVDFLQTEVGVDIEKHHTFAIVRNPFDRLVSWFHYHKVNVNSGADKKLTKHYKNSTFKKWVKDGCPLPDSWTREKDKYNPNPLHQHLWVCDSNGEIAVDFIGNFETLSKDFKTIVDETGVEGKLANDNSSEHKNYADYYDDDTISIVKEMFKKDLDLFNYGFDGLQG
jgi:hypothetical protein